MEQRHLLCMQSVIIVLKIGSKYDVMHPDKAHTHALTYQVRFLIKYVSVTHIPLEYFMDQRKTDSE